MDRITLMKEMQYYHDRMVSAEDALLKICSGYFEDSCSSCNGKKKHSGIFDKIFSDKLKEKNLPIKDHFEKFLDKDGNRLEDINKREVEISPNVFDVLSHIHSSGISEVFPLNHSKISNRFGINGSDLTFSLKKESSILFHDNSYLFCLYAVKKEIYKKVKEKMEE